MLTLVNNAKMGKAIPRRWNGRDYLVAPATTIVEGVLNGSHGSLYYPPQETELGGPAWKGIPLTMYHPMDGQGGMTSYAFSPGVEQRQNIGFVGAIKTNQGKKLQKQLWFDVEKTDAADKRFGTNVLYNIRNGIPVGVSTGLFTQDIPAPPGAHFNGRPYDNIATKHQPDHMAVLPDQVGACSLNDGCGVLLNVAASSNTGDTMTLEARLNRLEQLALNGMANPAAGVAVGGAARNMPKAAPPPPPPQQQQPQRGRMPSDIYTDNEGQVPDEPEPEPEVPQAPARKRMPVPINNAEQRAQATTVFNRLQAQSPDDGFVLNMWSDEARQAAIDARKAGGDAHRASVKSVMAKAAGYTGAKADAKAVAAHADAAKAYQNAIYHHATSAQAAGKAGTPEEVQGFNKLINAKDRHEQMSAHHAGGTVHNAAQPTGAVKKGYNDTANPLPDLDTWLQDDASDPLGDEDNKIGQGDRPPAKKGKNEPIMNRERAIALLKLNRRRPMAYNRSAAIQRLTLNCKCDNDVLALNALSDGMLTFLITNEEKLQGSNEGVIGEDTEEEVGGTKEEQNGGNKIVTGEMVTPHAKKDVPSTMNKAQKWLATMPEEFRPVWNSAVTRDHEARMALAQHITSNVADPGQKAAMLKDFMNVKRYDEPALRQLASLVQPQRRPVANGAYPQGGALNPMALQQQGYQPSPEVQQAVHNAYQTQQPIPLYLGANGVSVTGNAGQQDDDLLDIPTLNFAATGDEDIFDQAHGELPARRAQRRA